MKHFYITLDGSSYPDVPLGTIRLQQQDINLPSDFAITLCFDADATNISHNDKNGFSIVKTIPQ